MWQLKIRDKNKDWTELGSFTDIDAAARRVLTLEDDPTSALFFRVYIDPMVTKSDADILSRLEYPGSKGFYLLTRRVQ